MTFPILPAHELGLVLAVLIGFGFGFVLERAGFGRANKLAAQFYGHDMTVFKVMFSAIVTAMLGVVLASAVGLADFKALADHATSSTFLVPMIAGGFLLGAGFIVSGYCPGTSFVAMASGKLDGLMTVLGVIVGQVIWAELEWRPGFATFHNAGGLGNLYLWELFGLPGELRPVHRRGRRDGHGRRLLLRRGEARARPRRSGRPVRRSRRPRGGPGASCSPASPPPPRSASSASRCPPERGRRRARRPPSPRSRSPGACSTSPGSSASSISGRSRRARRSGSRAPSARRRRSSARSGSRTTTAPRDLVLVAAEPLAALPAAAAAYRGRVYALEGGWAAWETFALAPPAPPPAGAPAADVEAYRLRAGIHAAMTGMKAAPPPAGADRRAGRAAQGGRRRLQRLATNGRPP